MSLAASSLVTPEKHGLEYTDRCHQATHETAHLLLLFYRPSSVSLAESGDPFPACCSLPFSTIQVLHLLPAPQLLCPAHLSVHTRAKLPRESKPLITHPPQLIPLYATRIAIEMHHILGYLTASTKKRQLICSLWTHFCFRQQLCLSIVYVLLFVIVDDGSYGPQHIGKVNTRSVSTLLQYHPASSCYTSK